MHDSAHAALVALIQEASNAAEMLEADAERDRADDLHFNADFSELLAAGLRSKANAAMDALQDEEWSDGGEERV